jgi:hypothetical protein
MSGSYACSLILCIVFLPERERERENTDASSDLWRALSLVGIIWSTCMDCLFLNSAKDFISKSIALNNKSFIDI